MNIILILTNGCIWTLFSSIIENIYMLSEEKYIFTVIFSKKNYQTLFCRSSVKFLYSFFFFTTCYYLFLPLNLPKTTFLHDSIFCFQIPKSPQNDIFRPNFGSKFGLSWRSLRFAALRCCSYKVHYVNMVYGLKCCLKFWYNSCIFRKCY